MICFLRLWEYCSRALVLCIVLIFVLKIFFDEVVVKLLLVDILVG